LAYTYSQLQTIWTEGGGSPALAPIMAAIALAESSGNPAASGPGGSWGLWQVQPQDWPQFTPTDDPVTQASIANQILAQQGLGAWSTYTDGAYQQYYSPGTNPASTAFLASSTGTSTAASACIWSVGSLCLDKGIGVAGVLGGFAIIVLGFVVLRM
jgi:hypothetical protein